MDKRIFYPCFVVGCGKIPSRLLATPRVFLLITKIFTNIERILFSLFFSLILFTSTKLICCSVQGFFVNPEQNNKLILLLLFICCSLFLQFCRVANFISDLNYWLAITLNFSYSFSLSGLFILDPTPSKSKLKIPLLFNGMNAISRSL